MQKFINWVLLLSACVGVFYGIGLVVPRKTTEIARIEFATEPRELFGLIGDVSTWPSWYPDVVSVRKLPEKNGREIWSLTDKAGETFQLEVLESEKESLFVASYFQDGSRYTLRIVFGWAGEGGRLHLTKTVDTGDPWRGARLFLWDGDDVSAPEILDAVAEHFGEARRSPAL